MSTIIEKNQNAATESDPKPHHVAKTPKGQGRKSRLERIGVAWNRPQDNGICLCLTGTQIVDEDIYLYPIEADRSDEPAQ